jgi:hypothetical protein
MRVVERGFIGGVIRVSQGCGDKELNHRDHIEDTGSSKAKKCGAEIGDPNLRFQPRLPGSVVGEASMRQVRKADKITRVTVLW